MNLVEALRTGKSLRRPVARHVGSCRTGWLDNGYVRAYLTQENQWANYRDFALIKEEDLLADDWEVKSE